MNTITRHQTKTLKEALYDTIHHHHSLTVEAIAEQLDMPKSYLYRAALPDMDTDGENASGVRFPLKQLVPLIRTTNDYQVLDLIEFTLGRVAITIPNKNSTTVRDVQDNALSAMVEFGELIKEIQLAIADGNISDKEQERIERDGREAIQAIMLLINSKHNL